MNRKIIKVLSYGFGFMLNSLFVGICLLCIGLPLWLLAEVAFAFEPSKR